MLRYSRAAFEILLIIVFCAWVGLPGGAMLAGQRARPALMESRVEIPLAGVHAVDFPPVFYRFFQSSFAFRDRLIRLHALIKVKWLAVSPSPGVLVGEGGWLYYWADGERECCEASRPLTQEELAKWQTVLETRRDWLARRGAKFLFVVVPDKHTIYPEHLPGYLRHAGRESRLDQLLAYLRGRSNVEILDLRQALLSEKGRHQVYFKLDTHWDRIGAFIGYREILSRLARWFPEVRVPQWEDVEIAPAQAGQHDLIDFLGMGAGDLSDPVLSAIPKRPRPARVLADDPRVLDNGNAVVDVIISDSPGAAIPRAVVLRDSAAMSLIPLLSEHFGHATYLWTTDPYRRQVEREHPNVVIWEMTERWLMLPPPQPWVERARPTPPAPTRDANDDTPIPPT